jgi:hypothetical protein
MQGLMLLVLSLGACTYVTIKSKAHEEAWADGHLSKSPAQPLG